MSCCADKALVAESQEISAHKSQSSQLSSVQHVCHYQRAHCTGKFLLRLDGFLTPRPQSAWRTVIGAHCTLCISNTADSFSISLQRKQALLAGASSSQAAAQHAPIPMSQPGPPAALQASGSNAALDTSGLANGFGRNVSLGSTGSGSHAQGGGIGAATASSQLRRSRSLTDTGVGWSSQTCHVCYCKAERSCCVKHWMAGLHNHSLVLFATLQQATHSRPTRGAPLSPSCRPPWCWPVRIARSSCRTSHNTWRSAPSTPSGSQVQPLEAIAVVAARSHRSDDPRALPCLMPTRWC